MKRLVLLGLLLLLSCPAPSGAQVDTLRFGHFGKVVLYRNSPHPAHVVLFVSGDGGWNLGVVDMARALASMDAMVVGINVIHYLRQVQAASKTCIYPAADFEALSQFLQKKLGFPRYVTPILVGYSSGATLVYAILVQAPPNTFGGGISLGFSPDLPLRKPFCRGNGLSCVPIPKGKGYDVLPANNLEVPWIVFQGQIDKVCNPAATAAFVKKVRRGDLVSLPKVGHGYSVQRNWMPQFKHAFTRLVAALPEPPPPPDELSDLPLVEVPATGGAPATDEMAVLLTGDGGWGVTDRGVARGLAAAGIPAVALNSLRYFWTARTPKGASHDLERVLRHYLAAWRKERVLLVGYSLGADVLPFLVNRLPEDLRARVNLIALLGPGPTANFEFHLTDWLGGSSHDGAYPVRPEINRLGNVKILCFYGDDDRDQICSELDPTRVVTIPLRGGHRLGGDYAPVVQDILKQARRTD